MTAPNRVSLWNASTSARRRARVRTPHYLRSPVIFSALALASFAASLTLVACTRTSARPYSKATVAHGILLALGDSLASGYQPPDEAALPPVDPATGWRDGGYPGGYAADLAAYEHMRLIDLGCPGETTASYSNKPAQTACATLYRGEFGVANQQAAALRALAKYPGQVRLVTFDLGANDVDACLSGESVNAACLTRSIAAVLNRLPRLLASVKAALIKDDPGTPLAAMDYYDPFLALQDDPGGALASELAALSLGAVEALDASLRALCLRAGVLVADVSSEFQLASSMPPTVYRGMVLPHDVALVCRWTYMCPLPPAAGSGQSTAHPDVHPNNAGYARIAAAFEVALALHPTVRSARSRHA